MLTCTIWSQCTPIPDRQTDEHYGNRATIRSNESIACYKLTWNCCTMDRSASCCFNTDIEFCKACLLSTMSMINTSLRTDAKQDSISVKGRPTTNTQLVTLCFTASWSSRFLINLYEYDNHWWNNIISFGRHFVLNGALPSVIFVNENENGEKRENNEFVNEN